MAAKISPLSPLSLSRGQFREWRSPFSLCVCGMDSGQEKTNIKSREGENFQMLEREEEGRVQRDPLSRPIMGSK